MYSEIASNKRRSVIFIVVFFVIWLAIGAVCGLLFKAVYRHSATNGYAPTPPTNYGWTPVIVGMVICGLLAVCGILYSLERRGRTGAPGLGGRARPTRPSTSSCTTSSRPWPSARGSPSPPST